MAMWLEGTNVWHVESLSSGQHHYIILDKDTCQKHFCNKPGCAYHDLCLRFIDIDIPCQVSIPLLFR